MDITPRSFVAKRPGLVNVLLTKAFIGDPLDPQGNIPPKPKTEYTAIWDTGAQGTVITQKVVQECNLKQIGMAELRTVGGKVNKPVYFVSVYLPNRVIIPQLRVIEGEVSGGDILIGMDIMMRGDFAITNKDRKTVFTFRMPSMEVIDFVEKTASISAKKVTPIAGGSRAERRRAMFGR